MKKRHHREHELRELRDAERAVHDEVLHAHDGDGPHDGQGPLRDGPGPHDGPGPLHDGPHPFGPRHRRGHDRHSRRDRFRAEWRAERDLWRRHQHRLRWWPWWLRARMRWRIFVGFGLALGAGAWIGARGQAGELRWWQLALLLLFGWGIAGAVAWRLTRPLVVTIRAARDIGDGKLDTRVDVGHHGGEMRLLAAALNTMADKIQRQLSDQRQLLAAVSHELRTPLGHMRVLIETATDLAMAPSPNPSSSPSPDPNPSPFPSPFPSPSPDPNPSPSPFPNPSPSPDPSPTPIDRTMSILAQLDQEVLVLDDLVARLLASSRLEFGNLDRRPVDVAALVADVAVAAGVAPERISAEGATQIAIDPTLYRRAVANLLTNAQVHGGGVVAVRIERRDDQLIVEVDDAGPGLPAERHADAFRAFVPSQSGGLGLGLALVSRIAVAHGGKAWAEDRPGGGARVGFAVSA